MRENDKALRFVLFSVSFFFSFSLLNQTAKTKRKPRNTALEKEKKWKERERDWESVERGAGSFFARFGRQTTMSSDDEGINKKRLIPLARAFFFFPFRAAKKSFVERKNETDIFLCV